jgi:NADPH:quinone reductase
MRAIAIAKPGGPEVLTLVDRPMPEPSRGEVRVRVRATAINRADLLQRMGAYPAPADAPPDIPGLELAGEVDALGPGVERLAIGDRVFGLVGGGSYAEAVVSHERALAKIPAGLSFEQAAAVPEAFLTAHDAIVEQAGLRGGETLLVHAVGSGVGTAAVQLARALGLGAGVVPDGSRFADAVRAHGEPSVVLELVGGPYVDEDLRAVAPLGRIVLVGLLAGARHELDLALLLRKRIRLFGTVLRARPLEQKIAAMRAFEAQVVPMLARGLIAPVIDTVMDLDAAAAAHTRMASNEGFGKIVLRV